MVFYRKIQLRSQFSDKEKRDLFIFCKAAIIVRNTKDHPPLDELWKLQQEVDDWYGRWSDALTDAGLDEQVNFTLIGGNKGVMTRGEILLHIVNHTSYHRGCQNIIWPGATQLTTLGPKQIHPPELAATLETGSG